MSENTISRLQRAEIVPGYRTDHSAVCVELLVNDHHRGKGWFKFNVSLLKDEEYLSLMKETVCETLETYAVPVYSRQFVREDLGKLGHFNISCALLWETLILQLRTRTISYSIARHRNNKQRELDMLREIHELKEEFGRDPQSEVKQERLEMKKK